MCTLRKYKE
jgi:hypothetical protein